MSNTGTKIDTITTVTDVVLIEPLCESTIVVTSFEFSGLLVIAEINNTYVCVVY